MSTTAWDFEQLRSLVRSTKDRKGDLRDDEILQLYVIVVNIAERICENLDDIAAASRCYVREREQYLDG
jgi:hypothetical protein